MKKSDIILAIVLLLIAIQLLIAGYQNIVPGKYFYEYLTISLSGIVVGLLLVFFAVCMFLNKKWIKIPLIIILIIFVLYSSWWLFSTINNLYSSNDSWTLKLMKWQLFLLIEYLVLGIIALIMAWKKENN